MHYVLKHFFAFIATNHAKFKQFFPLKMSDTINMAADT